MSVLPKKPGNEGAAAGALNVIRNQLTPIARFFGRHNLTELWVNEPGRVWLRVAGKDPFTEPSADVTVDWAWDLCKYLANQNGIKFDEKMPVLACRIPGGHRFQAVIGPNVESRLAIAVRIKRSARYDYGHYGLRPNTKVVPPADLYSDKDETAESHPIGTLEDLLHMVRIGKPIVLSGGTNTGKTSLLNVVVDGIPRNKRIVTIEDAREIDLPHENKLHIVISRTATGTDVDYATVINSILRLSPDIVLLGEVSVDNAYPLLRLLNTGHGGFIGTIHANNPFEAIEALKRNIELNGHSSKGAVPFLARTIARIVQVQIKDGEERRIVAIERPADLDFRPLMEG